MSGGGAAPAIPWYTLIPQTDLVAVYQGAGAENYAASLKNLINPGTFDLIETNAPGWNATDGWVEME